MWWLFFLVEISFIWRLSPHTRPCHTFIYSTLCAFIVPQTSCTADTDYITYQTTTCKTYERSFHVRTVYIHYMNNYGKINWSNTDDIIFMINHTDDVEAIDRLKNWLFNRSMKWWTTQILAIRERKTLHAIDVTFHIISRSKINMDKSIIVGHT